VFDIYTIIFLALAVFIFLRLRSVLGQRTGRERPPTNPYARQPVPPTADKKVIPLPNRSAESVSPPASETPPAERWKGVAEPDTPLAKGLDAIVAVDPTFDVKHFIAGARAAYEMIVTAFAEGDRRTLKNLLSRDVYDNFDNAITGREQRGETVESRFVAINAADVIAAEQRDKSAQLTLRFVSQLVSVTRNKDGDVIDGNAEKVTDVTDVWTFVRDVSSRDPNWKLVATEAGR
jgi:predicted lipid-binding transport protein (Tim44 family)